MSLRASERQPVKRTVKGAVAVALAAAAGGLFSLGLAAPASAHAALTGTDPENGSTVVEAPAEVTATFSEILDQASTEIAVTDPAGAVIDVADPTYDGDTFIQSMLYTTPGKYTLAFRVISEDGHRVDDTIEFTVESIPAGLYVPGAEPTEPATGAETTAEASPSETTSRATGGMPSEDEDSNTGAALAAILLGLLVVVVGGVVLVKVVGRKQKDDSQQGGQGGEGSV